MFTINFCLNMFRASLCPSSGEQRPSYCIWCIVLVLLDVVGSGCGARQRLTTATNHINMFRASLCPSSGEKRSCYCIWFIVVGCCVCRMRALLASYNAAPHNRYQPHPAEPEQYTKCSNGFFVLLKMGIMMPETC